MGLFWDLIQQGQIGAQQTRSATLEARVARIEEDIERMQRLLLALLDRLEKRFGEDIDGDGHVG